MISYNITKVARRVLHSDPIVQCQITVVLSIDCYMPTQL
jgi:hypothetical protein